MDILGDPLTEPDDTMIQLLTPTGERVEHSGVSWTADAQAEAELLRGFYRDMALLRRLDVEATALQRHGEIGIWSQVLGQEAANIGAGRAMRRQDYVFPTYRDHGFAWCKGVDPLGLLELFRGVNRGGWDATETNCAYYTIVIGSHALHATGYAMGIQRDGAVGTGDPERDTAVVAAFGDGATAQGDVNEALVFAASYHSPVVFFCQNNQWAISEPTELHLRSPIYRRAAGFGMPGVRVDGNDVLATYAVMTEALNRAREGQGPTLVEAFTYRMGSHTTTDDPTRYRSADELEAWRARDPLARVEAYLRRGGHADQRFFDGIEAEAEELGHRLREGCKAIPTPDPVLMFDDVYAEMPASLAAQRAEFVAYRDSFLTEGSVR